MPSLPKSLVALGVVTILALAVKVLFWWIDPVVALHSDSGLYLTDAFTLQPSWPRPIGYGIFLRLLYEVLGAVRLGAIPLAQTAIGALLAAGTFAIARRYLQAPTWIAACGAALVTLSPGNLLLERYMLSDAVSLAILGLSLGCLLVYLVRPGPLRGILLGLGAVLPLVFRASWSLLPLVYLVLALYVVLYPRAPSAGDQIERQNLRRQDLRRQDLRRRAIAGLVVAVAVGFLSTVLYSAMFTRTNLGEVELSAGTSGFAGWTLWGSVGRFAEPGDLEGIPGGDILLSDPEGLQRNGSFQIWDFNSTAHRLRKEFHDGSLIKTNETLERAAIRVILRHPLQFTGQFLTAMKRFFLPIKGNNDYTIAMRLDPSVQKAFTTFIGLDIEDLDRTPTLTGTLYAQWRYSRWFFTSLLLLGFLWAGLQPRRRFMVFAVAAVGVSYLVVVNLAIGFIFVERYFLPVEYLGTVVLVGLMSAAWRHTRPASREVLGQTADSRR